MISFKDKKLAEKYHIKPYEYRIFKQDYKLSGLPKDKYEEFLQASQKGITINEFINYNKKYKDKCSIDDFKLFLEAESRELSLEEYKLINEAEIIKFPLEKYKEIVNKYQFKCEGIERATRVLFVSKNINENLVNSFMNSNFKDPIDYLVQHYKKNYKVEEETIFNYLNSDEENCLTYFKNYESSKYKISEEIYDAYLKDQSNLNLNDFINKYYIDKYKFIKCDYDLWDHECSIEQFSKDVENSKKEKLKLNEYYFLKENNLLSLNLENRKKALFCMDIGAKYSEFDQNIIDEIETIKTCGLITYNIKNQKSVNFAIRVCRYFGIKKITINCRINELENDVFHNYTELENVSLNDSLTRIKAYQFYNCSNLTTLIIPSSVRIVEKCAFLGCCSLNAIVLPKSLISFCLTGFESLLQKPEILTFNYQLFYFDKESNFYEINDVSNGKIVPTNYIEKIKFLTINQDLINDPSELPDFPNLIGIQFTGKGDCLGILNSLNLRKIRFLIDVTLSPEINKSKIYSIPIMKCVEGYNEALIKADILTFSSCNIKLNLYRKIRYQFLHRLPYVYPSYTNTIDFISLDNNNRYTKRVLSKSKCIALFAKNYDINNYMNIGSDIEGAFIKVNKNGSIANLSALVEALNNQSSGINFVVPLDVTELNFNFIRHKKIHNLVLPYGLKTIASRFFNECTIDNIEVNCDVANIRSDVFYKCSFKKITGEYALEFAKKFKCSNLVKEIISKIKFDNKELENKEVIENEEFAFRNIEELVIPKSVKKINSRAFTNCEKLRKITFEGQPTIADDAFENCLEVVDIVNFPFVQISGKSGFPKIKYINIDAQIIPSKTFYHWGLIKVTTTNKVNLIEESAFEGCKSLLGINKSDEFDVNFENKVKLASINCFKNTKIKTINYKNVECDLVDFVDNYSNEIVDIPYCLDKKDTIKILKNKNIKVLRLCENEGNKDLKLDARSEDFMINETVNHLELPLTIIEVTAKMLMKCKANLEYLKLPPTIKKVSITALKKCAKLKKILVPEYSLNLVDGLSKDLIEVYIKNEKEIEYLTISADNRGIATLPSSVDILHRSMVKDVHFDENVKVIPDNFFANFINLETVELPNKLQKIGTKAFLNCINLENIVIPNTVDLLGEFAFLNCEKLSRVNLSSRLRELQKGVFKNCTSLQEIFGMGGIKTFNSSVFTNCSSLEELIFPPKTESVYFDYEGMTNLKMFAIFDDLELLYIGDDLKLSNMKYSILPKNIEQFECDSRIYYSTRVPWTIKIPRGTNFRTKFYRLQDFIYMNNDEIYKEKLDLYQKMGYPLPSIMFEIKQTKTRTRNTTRETKQVNITPTRATFNTRTTTNTSINPNEFKKTASRLEDLILESKEDASIYTVEESEFKGSNIDIDRPVLDFGIKVGEDDGKITNNIFKVKFEINSKYVDVLEPRMRVFVYSIREKTIVSPIYKIHYLDGIKSSLALTIEINKKVKKGDALKLVLIEDDLYEGKILASKDYLYNVAFVLDDDLSDFGF